MSDVMDLVVLEGKVFDVIGVNDAKIAQAAEKFMPLTIKDMDDKAGYAAVHEGRMVVKGMRVMVEKHAKKVREKAIKFQKDVIAEKNRVVGLIQPIEDHLADEENRVEEEKARIKAEAEAKEAARVQARVNRLFAMGCRFDGASYIYASFNAPHALVKVASDEQFETFCGAIQAVIDEEEKQRLEEQALILKVQQEQEAERQRQARITAEQEIERQRLAKEAKAIQDEKDRLAREAKAAQDAKIAEEQAKVRAAEMEKAKADAAEKAIAATEERLKREAEERAAKEEAARVKVAKKEARRPDKERLLGWINNFSVPQMEMKTEEGNAAWMDILTIMEKAVADMKERAEAL